MSNSKLHKSAKSALVSMMASFAGIGGQVYSFPEYGVTVAMRGAGNGNAFASVSVASPDEKKFRRKVGRYLALSRMEDGEGVILAGAGETDEETYPHSWKNIAVSLANVVGHPDWANARNLDTGALFSYEDKKARRNFQYE